MTWGLQLVAEIDPERRGAIEEAIENLICPDHVDGDCRLLSMSSTTGTDEHVLRWLDGKPPS